MSDSESSPDPLASLASEVVELRDLIQRRLLDDKQRQQMYDELYRQLEFSRKGLADQYVAPILREVLLVVDRIDTMTVNTPTAGIDSSSELFSVRQELEEVLLRRGVRELGAAGEKFDPRVHQAVGREPVTAPEQAGHVVAVRRSGYALEDRLLRPAEVVVGYLE